jgi:putative methionine-R-sulfoxide reductase with GAF domain
VSTFGDRSNPWAARSEHLSGLASADALAIVVVGGNGPVTFAQHNLLDVEVNDDLRSAPLPITLADGRAAPHRHIAPITWAGKTLGAVVGLRVGRPWDQKSRARIRRASALIAVDLADTYELWTSRRAAEHQARRARTLEEIRRDFARTDDADAVIAAAARRVSELLDASGVSVMLLENDDELVVRSAFGANEQLMREGRRRVGEGISGWVAKHGEPLILNGHVDDERFRGVDPSIEEALVVPLRSGDRVLGVVNVRTRRDRGVTDPERLRALNIVANDLAALVERAEAAVSRLERLQRAEADRGQALALFDLARLTGGQFDLQAGIEAASALVAHAFRHDVVGIWLANGDPRRLHLRAAVGYGDVLPGDLNLDADDVAARIVGEARARRVERATGRAWMGLGIDSHLLVPIQTAGSGTTGLLVLGREREPYARVDVDLAVSVAEILSQFAAQEHAALLLQEAKAERRRIIAEMQRDFATQLTRVVSVLDVTQGLLRKDPDLPTQLATAAREARGFLGRFGNYVAALDNELPAITATAPIEFGMAETPPPPHTPHD